MIIQPLDIPRLQREFHAAEPFPFVYVDGFFDPEFVEEVAAAYPTFDEARQMGNTFRTVNERLKVQVTDSSRFPPVVKRLSDALAADEFLATLRAITGIEGLVADPELAGGGMHVTGSSGRLDVHVDFNFASERKLWRRLNILVYLNPTWEDAWGGGVELWDREVKVCHHVFKPILNRVVLFETSEHSFHGVEQVRCPEGVVRKSFAAYYYTHEPNWTGTTHSTIFRARPDENLKGKVLMPLEQAGRRLREGLGRSKRAILRKLDPH